jgi:pyruvate ferredoxin oxidoreductase gamma subunit
MLEIRVHGLGGQGAVTLVTWLVKTGYDLGKHVQAFPFFGAERRGAPVKAFARIDDDPIDLRSQVYRADLLVVMSRDLAEPALEDGIAPDGSFLVNGTGELGARLTEELGLGVHNIDATGIALDLGLEIEGMPMVNLPLFGATSALSGVIGLEAALDVIRPIGTRVGRSDDYESAIRRGFDEIGYTAAGEPSVASEKKAK